MAAMDDPGMVVNTIIRVSLHPWEEVAVGWKAQGGSWSHHLAPDLTERIAADVAHRYQIKTAPPAPPTSGSLYTPMAQGRGVEGGVGRACALRTPANGPSRRHHCGMPPFGLRLFRS
jgi:hypothetical protein